MSAVDDLLSAIFDDRPSDLLPVFESWLRGSRRFRAFAAEHRAKIRAKLRNVRDEHGLKDVRAELETAALLLREERFALEYEKYAAARQRGPDFTVTYKTHTPFNVEVRRLRSVELANDEGASLSGKLMAILCDKVGQMPAGIVNVLWLTAEHAVAEADLTGAAVTLRQLVERKDDAFFARRGYAGASAFLKQYRHLSGILLRQPGAHALWQNPLARHALPPDLAATLRRLAAP